MEGGELKEGGPVSAAPLHWIPNQSPGGSVPLLPLKAVYDSSQAQAGEKPAILGVGWGNARPRRPRRVTRLWRERLTRGRC